MIIIVYKHKDHKELVNILRFYIEKTYNIEVNILNEIKLENYNILHIFVDLHQFFTPCQENGIKMPKKYIIYNYQQIPYGRWKKIKKINFC